MIDAARSIADGERQEDRWLAPDAHAWERPEEEISVLIDDCVFEDFILTYGGAFSLAQINTAIALRDAVNEYCDANPGWLDPVGVLADRRWQEIREKARAFIAAFENHRP